MVERFNNVSCAGSGGDHWTEMQEDPEGLWVAFDDYDALAAERDALRKDAERLNWLERWITDNSGGFEIYPIGPDEEYEADGSIVGVAGPIARVRLIHPL